MPASTIIHRFDLVVRDGQIVVLPTLREVNAGEWVQFVSSDTHVYSVHFLEASFQDPAAWSFLESGHQTASPPLVEPGSRFILTFEGAPSGVYPFQVDGQGRSAEGSLRVR